MRIGIATILWCVILFLSYGSAANEVRNYGTRRNSIGNYQGKVIDIVAPLRSLGEPWKLEMPAVIETPRGLAVKGDTELEKLFKAGMMQILSKRIELYKAIAGGTFIFWHKNPPNSSSASEMSEIKVLIFANNDLCIKTLEARTSTIDMPVKIDGLGDVSKSNPKSGSTYFCRKNVYVDHIPYGANPVWDPIPKKIDNHIAELIKQQ